MSEPLIPTRWGRTARRGRASALIKLNIYLTRLPSSVRCHIHERCWVKCENLSALTRAATAAGEERQTGGTARRDRTSSRADERMQRDGVFKSDWQAERRKETHTLTHTHTHSETLQRTQTGSCGSRYVTVFLSFEVSTFISNVSPFKHLIVNTLCCSTCVVWCRTNNRSYLKRINCPKGSARIINEPSRFPLNNFLHVVSVIADFTWIKWRPSCLLLHASCCVRGSEISPSVIGRTPRSRRTMESAFPACLLLLWALTGRPSNLHQSGSNRTKAPLDISTVEKRRAFSPRWLFYVCLFSNVSHSACEWYYR